MLWLLLTIATLRYVCAAECEGKAFALPLRDVLVDPDIENSYIIGIPASVGIPGQDVVLLPWAELNNTYLYDENTFCDPTVIFDDTICRIRRGGLFLESDSTSWQQSTDLTVAGGALQETENPDAEDGIKDLISTSLGGTDQISLAASGVLANFPIGIPRLAWDHGYSTLHPLGMGSNSTYLNALYQAGSIGARVWSLFWGRMWTNTNPLNGSLVLGGYDERLIIGENYTTKLDYSGACFTGLKMNVLGITLNFRNGTDIPFVTDETPGCIIPTRQNLLGLQYSYQTLFQNLTQTETIGDSFGIHWGSMLFDADEAYDGDITIALATGLSVRVSNDQFVPPFVTYDRNGSRIFNESQKEVLISRLGENTITLGRYFLTASYLMVDYEANTFTMWKANPTADSSIKAVVQQNTSNVCTNVTTGGGHDLNPSSHTTDSKLSTGAIAGIAIGVVLIVALLAAATFFIWRRHNRKSTKAPSSTPSDDKCTGPYEMNDSQIPRDSIIKWLPVSTRAESDESYTEAQPVDQRIDPTYQNQDRWPSGLYELADPNQIPSTPLMRDRNL